MKKWIMFFQSFLIVTVTSIVLSKDMPRTLYVLNGLGHSISKMNLDTYEITNDFITVGDIPNQIFAKDDKIYVINSVPPGISIIDASTETISNIALPENSNPWSMAFIGTNKAYITNWMAGTVSVVDLEKKTILKNIEVGIGPSGILVVGNFAYVANTGAWPAYNGSSVAIIDIYNDVVTKTLDVPANPQDFALTPPDSNNYDVQYIHVICTGNWADVTGKVCIIDPYGDVDYTQTVVDTIEVGGTPGSIAITKDGFAYLADAGDQTNGYLYSYHVFTKEVYHDATNPILVGAGPINLLYNGNANELWVSNFNMDNVQLLDPANGTVSQTFGFGDGAQDIALLGPIYGVDAWADAVVEFNPGSGAGFGQNFFPANVLGPPDPDPTLSIYVSSKKPQELLSLGNGGEIILEFTDNYIIDGEGVDFTVFENVMIDRFSDEPFIEAAIVAVSKDGENFMTFPYDTATWAGLAGVTPTRDNQHPDDPAVSGGDSFDLSVVGLEYARFVKITDLGDIKQEGAWNFDFDLDAVVAVNSVSGQPIAIATQTPETPQKFSLAQNYPNPFNPETAIEFSLPKRSHIEVSVYNHLGQQVKTLVNGVKEGGTHQIIWRGCDENGKDVSSGVYFYKMKSENYTQVKKMTLLH